MNGNIMFGLLGSSDTEQDNTYNRCVLSRRWWQSHQNILYTTIIPMFCHYGVNFHAWYTTPVLNRYIIFCQYTALQLQKSTVQYTTPILCYGLYKILMKICFCKRSLCCEIWIHNYLWMRNVTRRNTTATLYFPPLPYINHCMDISGYLFTRTSLVSIIVSSA